MSGWWKIFDPLERLVPSGVWWGQLSFIASLRQGLKELSAPHNPLIHYEILAIGVFAKGIYRRPLNVRSGTLGKTKRRLSLEI
jgi:hypothetical protein